MKAQNILAAALLMAIILAAMLVAFPKLATLLSEVGVTYYEWGQKPNIVFKEEQVSSGYVLQKGEYGKLVGSLKCNDVFREDQIPAPQMFIDKVVEFLKGKGAEEVCYLKIHLQKDFAYWGGPEHSFAYYYVTVHIDECVFKADPVVVDDLVMIAIVIIIVVGALTFYFLWAYSPVIYHLAQVPPEDVWLYQLGQAVPMLLWIFLVIVVGVIVLAYVKRKQQA